MKKWCRFEFSFHKLCPTSMVMGGLMIAFILSISSGFGEESPEFGDENNAAFHYQRADEAFRRLSEEDRVFMNRFAMQPEWQQEAAKEIVGRAAPVLEELRKGSRSNACDWGLDWGSPQAINTKSWPSFLNLTSCLLLAAQVAIEDGRNDAAMDYWKSAVLIRCHLGKIPLIILELQGIAMETQILGNWSRLLPMLDKPTKKELVELLGLLPDLDLAASLAFEKNIYFTWTKGKMLGQEDGEPADPLAVLELYEPLLAAHLPQDPETLKALFKIIGPELARRMIDADERAWNAIMECVRLEPTAMAEKHREIVRENEKDAELWQKDLNEWLQTPGEPPPPTIEKLLTFGSAKVVEPNMRNFLTPLINRKMFLAAIDYIELGEAGLKEHECPVSGKAFLVKPASNGFMIEAEPLPFADPLPIPGSGRIGIWVGPLPARN
jgi:hypothetical protein